MFISIHTLAGVHGLSASRRVELRGAGLYPGVWQMRVRMEVCGRAGVRESRRQANTAKRIPVLLFARGRGGHRQIAQADAER